MKDLQIHRAHPRLCAFAKTVLPSSPICINALPSFVQVKCHIFYESILGLHLRAARILHVQIAFVANPILYTGCLPWSRSPILSFQVLSIRDYVSLIGTTIYSFEYVRW